MIINLDSNIVDINYNNIRYCKRRFNFFSILNIMSKKKTLDEIHEK